MLVEICANSYQSAVNAQEAGAHRIELFRELAVGGSTPSYGLIKQVIDTLQIPVYVLIRRVVETLYILKKNLIS